MVAVRDSVTRPRFCPARSARLPLAVRGLLSPEFKGVLVKYGP
jgi:hypothetical protein